MFSRRRTRTMLSVEQLEARLLLYSTQISFSGTDGSSHESIIGGGNMECVVFTNQSDSRESCTFEASMTLMEDEFDNRGTPLNVAFFHETESPGLFLESGVRISASVEATTSRGPAETEGNSVGSAVKPVYWGVW